MSCFRWLVACSLAAIFAFSPTALPGQSENQNEPELRSNIEKLQQAQKAGESFEAAEAATERGGGEEALQEYLAAKLVVHNYSNIRLAELAAQRAQFDPVRQLAESIAEDHRQLTSALEQVVPVSDLFDIGPAEVVSESASLQASEQGPTSGKQTTSERSGSGQEKQSSQEATPLLHAGVTHQLLRIDRKAAVNYLRMTNALLREHEGQDFDTAFLSQQVAAHARMLADLQAMEGVGTQAFQEVLQQGSRAAQDHLERAKELAKKVERDRPRSAQRPDTGDRQRSDDRRQ